MQSVARSLWVAAGIGVGGGGAGGSDSPWYRCNSPYGVLKKWTFDKMNRHLSLNCFEKYLCLSSVDHEIIKLAKDALLKLVPGNTPVLSH